MDNKSLKELLKLLSTQMGIMVSALNQKIHILKHNFDVSNYKFHELFVLFV